MTSPRRSQGLVAKFTSRLVLAAIAVSIPVHGAVVSFDITDNSGGDAFTPGAALFGTGASIWNERIRLNSASALALVDDSGAATTVTVSYVRSAGIGTGGITGAFAGLGISSVQTGAVALNGLTPGLAYDLVIYSSAGGSPSWTVGSATKSTAQSFDWSTLTEGRQYVRFSTTADGSGNVTFTPNSEGAWSGFQIQPTSVPEPTQTGIAAGFAALAFGLFRKHRIQG